MCCDSEVQLKLLSSWEKFSNSYRNQIFKLQSKVFSRGIPSDTDSFTIENMETCVSPENENPNHQCYLRAAPWEHSMHIPLHTWPTGLWEGSDVSSLSPALALCGILSRCTGALEVSSVLLSHPHLHAMYHPALTLHQEVTVPLNKCSSVRFRIDTCPCTMGKTLPPQNY